MGSIRSAVLIAGGQGTRIRSISGDRIPKALVPVAGKPIVFWQMENLARYGVERIAVMAGHLAEHLMDKLPDRAEALGIELEFFVEEFPLGTAGNLPSAREFLGGDPFFVVYADVVFDLDFERLANFHIYNRADATIVCHPNDHPHESDLLRVDSSWQVLEILPRKNRPKGWYRNLVPSAIYVLSDTVFEHIEPNTKQDFIKDVFPKMISGTCRVMAYNTPEYLRDMGTPERYASADEHIRSGRVAAMNFSRRRAAIFFDRDGVLNVEPKGNGVISVEQLELLPGAAKAVRRVNESGRLAIVATNQPQIAKGFITFEDLEQIHAKLETLLGFEGAWLDRIYFCPHHPERGFEGEVEELKIDCECRKPKPGLLLEAAQYLPIDMSKSAMIGDSWRDAGAARAAGVRFYGVRTGFGCEGCVGEYLPDMVFDSVYDAIDFLLSDDPIAEVLVSEICEIAQKREKDEVLMIGICGVARSGKSSLSHRAELMIEERGIPVLRVQLDQWILPESERNFDDPPEVINRVRKYREIFSALRNGESVVAPGYDSKTREKGKPVIFNPAGKKVIIFDGLFACHSSVRDLIDLSVYVDSNYETIRKRFMKFYEWKGLPEEERERLFVKRTQVEWPAIHMQTMKADLVLKRGFSEKEK